MNGENNFAYSYKPHQENLIIKHETGQEVLSEG